jgi:hypothetical protein
MVCRCCCAGGGWSALSAGVPGPDAAPIPVEGRSRHAPVRRDRHGRSATGSRRAVPHAHTGGRRRVPSRRYRMSAFGPRRSGGRPPVTKRHRAAPREGLGFLRCGRARSRSPFSGRARSGTGAAESHRRPPSVSGGRARSRTGDAPSGSCQSHPVRLRGGDHPHRLLRGQPASRSNTRAEPRRTGLRSDYAPTTDRLRRRGRP